jgi:hypothetical protein
MSSCRQREHLIRLQSSQKYSCDIGCAEKDAADGGSSTSRFCTGSAGGLRTGVYNIELGELTPGTTRATMHGQW